MNTKTRKGVRYGDRRYKWYDTNSDNKGDNQKVKLASALRGNGETIGILIGSLVDKELKRLGIKGNNDE